MTPTESKKITALIAMSFPLGQFHEGHASAYEQLMAKLDYEPTLRAVEHLAQTQKFLPAFSEIREAMLELENGTRRTGAEAYGVPKFTDDLTAYAVERCGWRNLCLEGSSDAADRARFIEVYEAASERRQRAEKSGLELPARGDPVGLLRGRTFAPRIGGTPKLFGEHRE
jgi:hypothetical protein